MKLDNRVALVMGGGHSSNGLTNGAAAALAFAREGAKVVVVDKDLQLAQNTVDAIARSDAKHPALAQQADVTNEEQVRNVFEHLSRQLGGLDILHNNVGVEFMGGLLETDIATWRRAFAINLESAIIAMQLAIPLMLQRQRGSIINVSSTASLKYSGVKYISYNTTKAALNQLTKVVAGEYARQGIRCNVLVPGMIATPHVKQTFGTTSEAEIESIMAARANRVPLGRQGTPQDIANLAVFLASDDSSFITGQTMIADGGALV